MKYDLRKEKIAVHCQTLEEADKVQLKFKEIYNTYYNFSSRHKYWQYYGSETCFCVYSENNNDFGYSPKSFYEEEGYQIISASDYLSQFEEVPKYGDTVWDEDENERIFAGFINGVCCVFDNIKEKEDFEKGDVYFCITPIKHYRTTAPTLDLPTLTLQEIADLKGVTLEQAKEMINKLK